MLTKSYMFIGRLQGFAIKCASFKQHNKVRRCNYDLDDFSTKISLQNIY
jgi:hypothetical protein